MLPSIVLWLLVLMAPDGRVLAAETYPSKSDCEGWRQRYQTADVEAEGRVLRKCTRVVVPEEVKI